MTDESETVGVATRTVGTDTAMGTGSGTGSGGAGAADASDLVEEPVKVGDVVGSFRVIELLGRGGMGRVFRGEHVKLGRAVALKVLNRKYSNNREAVRRLFGEARAVNQIRHENLIEITDFLEPPDGVACYVMELLQGDTVRGDIKRGPMAPDRVADIGAQVASALAAVHAIGIIHRDLKPENIFLTTRGERGDFVKLLDFGVAKLSPEVAGDPSLPAEDSAVLGTPLYMSPEQLSKGTADAATDVYSLGVTLYEMVTGARPFSGTNRGEIVIKHVLEPPPPLARPGVPPTPPELERLILDCLAKEPAQRPTTTALADALRALTAELRAELPAPLPVEPPRARWPRLAAAAVVVGAVAAVALLALSPTEPATPPLALPANVTLRFESTPSGATVRRTGEAAPLGVTPFSLELPRSDQVATFIFEIEGRPAVESRASLASAATLSALIPEAPTPTPTPTPEPKPREGKPAKKERGKKPLQDDTIILDPFAR